MHTSQVYAMAGGGRGEGIGVRWVEWCRVAGGLVTVSQYGIQRFVLLCPTPKAVCWIRHGGFLTLNSTEQKMIVYKDDVFPPQFMMMVCNSNGKVHYFQSFSPWPKNRTK